MPPIVVFKGSYAYTITGQITDRDGNVVDLTDATVTFYVGNIGDIALIKGGSVTVTDAINGNISYTVQSGDFDTAGRFEAQLKIVWSTGKVMWGDTFDFIVRDTLG